MRLRRGAVAALLLLLFLFLCRLLNPPATTGHLVQKTLVQSWWSFLSIKNKTRILNLFTSILRLFVIRAVLTYPFSIPLEYSNLVKKTVMNMSQRLSLVLLFNFFCISRGEFSFGIFCVLFVCFLQPLPPSLSPGGMKETKKKVMSKGSPVFAKAVYNLWSASCRAMMPSKSGSVVQPQELRLYRTFIRNSRRCVYCGDPATAMDHFRAFMQPRGRPSGFQDDMWNMVPCCITCNSSKGNRNWRLFMSRKSGKTPLARGVSAATHRRRVRRLEAFELTGNKYVEKWASNKFTVRLDALRTSMLQTMAKHAVVIRRLGLHILKYQEAHHAPQKTKTREEGRVKKCKLEQETVPQRACARARRACKT